jgi:TolB-like protein
MILKYTSIIITISILFTACSQNNTHINNSYKTKSSIFFNTNNTYDDLDTTIGEIANQLLVNIKSSTQKNNKLALTSFVNLNEFTQTSDFGRALGESLFNELHVRKFKLLDYRSLDTILVNKTGEFSLTRDILKLKDSIPEALIVVGTYSLLENNKIVINTRIINNFTSDVLSTSKVVYKYQDCKKFNLCGDKFKKVKIKNNQFIQDDYL